MQRSIFSPSGFIFIILIFWASSAPLAQLSLFMENLPDNGDWVEYNSVTTDSKGVSKTETIRVALVGEEIVDGVAHVWFEFSPIKFVGKDKGVLKLLVKKSPSLEEIEDPLSMTQKLIFQAPGKTAVLVERGTITRATSLGGSLKMSIKKDLVRKEFIEISGKKLKCNLHLLDSQNELDGALTRKTLLVYRGDLWLCPDIPFHVGQANLEIEKTKKNKTKIKTQTLVVTAFGFGNAQTQITGKPEKKGLLGLILMD